MRYNHYDNNRILRLTTCLVIGMIVITAIATGAWWRDAVNSGQNIYSLLRSTSVQQMFNPKRSPVMDKFTLRPTDAVVSDSYFLTDGLGAQNAQHLNQTTTSVASPSRLQSKELSFVYVQTVQRTMENILDNSQVLNSFSYIGSYRPDYQSAGSNRTSSTSNRTPSAAASLYSRNMSGQSAIYNSPRGDQSAIGRNRSSSSSSFTSPSEVIILAEEPAAATARTNPGSGFPDINCPLSLGWDGVLLLILLSLGYAFYRRRSDNVHTTHKS